MVWQAPSPQQAVTEHQTPPAWAGEQAQAWEVPRTSCGEITAFGIPWLCLAELDQVHVLHSETESGLIVIII